MKEEASTTQPSGDSHGSLGPCPPRQAHILLMDPQEESKKQGTGLSGWTLPMLRGPKSQKSKTLFCTISVEHRRGFLVPESTRHQPKSPPLCTPRVCFPPYSASLGKH